MTYQQTDFDPIAFEVKHHQDYKRSLSQPIEVDSHYDFGTLFYRVWKGMRCIGTFHRVEVDCWLANHHYNAIVQTYHQDADEAQEFIIRSYQELAS